MVGGVGRPERPVKSDGCGAVASLVRNVAPCRRLWIDLVASQRSGPLAMSRHSASMPTDLIKGTSVL
jgi:hypothetical protein